MTKTKLPKWFDGQVYDAGDVVTNPFSGEEFYLNGEELSIYDFIMGLNYVGDHRGWDNEMINLHQKSLRWFSKNNIKAYMALLD